LRVARFGLLLTFLFPLPVSRLAPQVERPSARLLGHGVDRGFVKEVTESWRQERPALFLVFDQLNPSSSPGAGRLPRPPHS
jgi:uncharacterized membrane protein